MKKIFKISFIFIVVLGLVFSNGRFEYAKNNSFVPVKEYSPIPNLIQVKAEVKVSQAQTAKSQSLAVNTLEKKCVLDLINNPNFLQDASVINLNQPANCFSMSLGKVRAMQALKVQPLASSQPQIVVIELPKAVLASQNFNPTTPFVPFAPILPLMPVLALVMVISSLIKINMGFVARTESQKYFHQFTIHELQVLRC